MAIPTRIDVKANVKNVTANAYNYNGGGINHVIETPTGVHYIVYINSANDPVFVKSLDFGLTWGAETSLETIECNQLTVWYDRWSGINAGLIHVAFTDLVTDDVFYRTIDTENSDTLGTKRTVFLGGTASALSSLSISKMIGGNIIVVGAIDQATEPLARKSTDGGANWTDISSVYEAVNDAIIMLPGWGADNQDGMAFYWDYDANEISVKYYDDSGNSWSETSLATSMLKSTTSDSFGHFQASVDLTNSQNLLVAWSAIDTANADLRCWKVTQSAQTELTNVVLNSTDDQTFACISILGTDWYCFYCGSSDGTEDVNANLRLYMKKSTDGGSTWGSETKLSNIQLPPVKYVFTKPIAYKNYGAACLCLYALIYNTSLAIPRTTFQFGM